MSKASESIKRGVRQAIRHSRGKRVGGLKLHVPPQMEIKPIRTKADHRAALAEIETLMNAKAGTPEGERLDALATLVEAYERKH
jgi:hypothetical protein